MISVLTRSKGTGVLLLALMLPAQLLMAQSCPTTLPPDCSIDDQIASGSWHIFPHEFMTAAVAEQPADGAQSHDDSASRFRMSLQRR